MKSFKEHREDAIDAVCEAMELPTLEEAKYQGKTVTLNDPIRTSENPNKKFKVYVKGPKGKVVVVRFGDPNLSIKKAQPKRRKSFIARHNYDAVQKKKDVFAASYWSCKNW